MGAKLNPLTWDQAVETWVLYWTDEPVVQIAAKFRVDPRRLYEVWHLERHVGSRALALEKLRSSNPKLAKLVEEGGKDPLQNPQRLRKYQKKQGTQRTLFD